MATCGSRGSFSTIGGRAQGSLATVDPATGAVRDTMGLAVAGVHNGGSTNVMKVDVTPDGSRLVAIGNFDTVAGQRRHQLAVLDTSGPTAAVAFGTAFYEAPCGQAWDTYMRDVSVSPDGAFFVVGTTGGYGGAVNACDTTARFETASTGDAVEPSWVDKTGGDTTYAVEVTDSVVYTGGHARWQNNPFRSNEAGAGAVERPGIAALDPQNGLPLRWNPTRTRGVGVFDFLDTPQGLWVASDTDRIGSYAYRGRIALLPPAVTTFPAQRRPSLPDDVHLLGAGGGQGVTVRRVDPGGVPGGPDRSVPAGGTDWSQVTGAFMLNGELYAGWRDGELTRQTFDGTTFGARVPVDAADDLVRLDAWHGEVDDITAMFYDQGRLYFTLAGSTTLHYRYLAPESDVVGARRLSASGAVAGFNPRDVRGMVLAGSDLYWSDSSGTLRRTPWDDGALAGSPRAGATTVVSGPGVDGRDWNARALVAFQDPQGRSAYPAGDPPPPNQAPEAAFTASCDGLTCELDGRGSVDPDGAVSSWSWDLGDGSTASGPTTSRTYAAAGSYEVTLTVRDSSGATGTTTRTVRPTAAEASLSLVGATGATGAGREHRVDVPAAARPGDAMVLFLTLNSGEGSLTAPPGWTPLETGDAANFRSRAWTRTATTGDAGSAVVIGTERWLKSDVSLTVLRGGGAATVTDSAVAVTASARSRHTSPQVDVDRPGSWVVSYFGEKSSGSTTWTAPAGAVERRQGSTGGGGGAVSALLADSGGPVPTGTAGGLDATTDHDTSRAVTYSVVVAPG